MPREGQNLDGARSRRDGVERQPALVHAEDGAGAGFVVEIACYAEAGAALFGGLV